MISILVTALISAVLVVIPVWIGTRLGYRQREKLGGQVDHSPIGSVVGAGLGLFAFILAFTFQMTTTRFDSRKDQLMAEVGSIRTTYMRAELLKDSNRIPCRQLLKRYLDLRIKFIEGGIEYDRLIRRSTQIQDSLWLQAVTLAQEDRSSEMYALFASSINEMVDVYHKRIVTGLHYRLPPVIRWVLYFIAFFSMMLLGFQFGISGKGNPAITVVLALIFAAVIWLINALDDPTSKIVRINHKQVYELQQELEANP